MCAPIAVVRDIVLNRISMRRSRTWRLITTREVMSARFVVAIQITTTTVAQPANDTNEKEIEEIKEIREFFFNLLNFVIIRNLYSLR